MHACHARICLHAYAMHTYVDVDMQMHIFMQVNAYAYICMHGMHIPLAGGAHPGGPHPLGGGRWTWDLMHIYIYICTHIHMNIRVYVRIQSQTYWIKPTAAGYED